ncbi:hypothetical protein JK231_00110 [Pantoea sp. JGM49]|uniref:hypothetical protein n=1 Tax=Pantoea sp. JGM49 TaxID=2799791 RepID=UPI001BADCE9D|nr:hypothetical protein [Pantoea sp. JGM49]MBS0879006.1 hypothetical protein [Pantoea sp. JGM49]
MDLSPVFHACAAVAVQCLFGLILNDWHSGAVLGCLWFIAREQTQAEYRWIAMFGDGHRKNMPWWGGFAIRAWDIPSLLDMLVPVVACAVVYTAVILLG